MRLGAVSGTTVQRQPEFIGQGGWLDLAALFDLTSNREFFNFLTLLLCR